MEGPVVGGDLPPHKKLRGEDGAIVTASYPSSSNSYEIRSSSLPSSTLLLTGHKGSVYALQYSPNGQTLCSTSFDMSCLLWNHSTTEDISECYHNYNVLTGHKNAVLDCHWCNDDTIVTCSADKTVQLWDANTATRLRKWQQHTGIVNACASTTTTTTASSTMVVSASDDGSCFLWDPRQKSAVGELASEYPVTAVAVDDAQHVYTAGLEHNMIYCWDVRTRAKVYGMKGHTDIITCLALHPEGTHLLSNSMDHSLRTWDIRPYITGKNRHCKTFVGHKHNAEKGLLKCSWSKDGSMVTGGSADKMVHIWDEFSTEELYLLPGHKGCVNTVVFHPHENVIASGGSDKQIFVGELS